MTFSVVARDPTTGDLGVAVQSKFLAVGAAVIHASGAVGAIATQALANLSYGYAYVDCAGNGCSMSCEGGGLCELDACTADCSLSCLDEVQCSLDCTDESCVVD